MVVCGRRLEGFVVESSGLKGHEIWNLEKVELAIAGLRNSMTRKVSIHEIVNSLLDGLIMGYTVCSPFVIAGIEFLIVQLPLPASGSGLWHGSQS